MTVVGKWPVSHSQGLIKMTPNEASQDSGDSWGVRALVQLRWAVRLQQPLSVHRESVPGASVGSWKHRSSALYVGCVCPTGLTVVSHTPIATLPFSSRDSTLLHYTALHCPALHSMSFHSIPLYPTPPHCFLLYSILPRSSPCFMHNVSFVVLLGALCSS